MTPSPRGLLRRWFRATVSPDLVDVDVPGAGSFRMWHLDGRDQVARDVAAGGLAGFEAPMPEVFAALVQQSGGTVLDVGANTGFYSLLAVTCGAARVVAFEPFAPVLAHLRANLAINEVLATKIDVVPCAVGADAGSALLHIPPPTGSLVETSASLSASFKEQIAESFEVPVVTVDDHATDESISLVKVDVEGMDHVVLQGAVRCMTDHRPLVFIEVLPRAEMRMIEQLVAASGHRILPLRTAGLDYSERVEFHPDAHNQLLVPTERADEVLELLRTVVGDAADGSGVTPAGR